MVTNEFKNLFSTTQLNALQEAGEILLKKGINQDMPVGAMRVYASNEKDRTEIRDFIWEAEGMLPTCDCDSSWDDFNSTMVTVAFGDNQILIPITATLWENLLDAVRQEYTEQYGDEEDLK
jgi:hypothetical protein